MKEIVIEEENSLQRLDTYLTTVLSESRNFISKNIKNGNITVNDNIVKNGYMLKVGDIIKIKDLTVDTSVKAEDIPLQILYEDNDIIVVNKKSGMVVHPGNGNTTGTLVNALLHHTKELSDINGDVRPGIVHRIDKDTSGIMIAAKNNKAHELLSDMLSKHEINREYIALVKGEFPNDTATIDAPIGRDEKNRIRMSVTAKNSKEAVTHLRVIKRYKGYTLLRLKLETGRTHQIRVHLNYIGYPIVNDPLYGTCDNPEFGKFLHSTSIKFKHPITGKELSFECDIPKEFKAYLETLEEKE
jgi:23S rRNA pseudouridine1911/1915/1917 synthase